MTYFSEISAYSEIREVSKINLHKIILSDVTTFFKYKTEYNDVQNRQDFRANFYTLCVMVALCFVFKLIYCDK
jgi:hypothetical protein